MIKAEDLRFGNKLEYFVGEEGLTWEPFTVDWQDIKEAQCKPDCFNARHRPIELSPEILEKAGFLAVSDWKHYEIELDLELELLFGVELINFNAWIRYGKGTHADQVVWPKTKVQYVHQLQNFIHAFTGTELEINL